MWCGAPGAQPTRSSARRADLATSRCPSSRGERRRPACWRAPDPVCSDGQVPTRSDAPQACARAWARPAWMYRRSGLLQRGSSRARDRALVWRPVRASRRSRAARAATQRPAPSRRGARWFPSPRALRDAGAVAPRWVARVPHRARRFAGSPPERSRGPPLQRWRRAERSSAVPRRGCSERIGAGSSESDCGSRVGCSSLGESPLSPRASARVRASRRGGDPGANAEWRAFGRLLWRGARSRRCGRALSTAGHLRTIDLPLSHTTRSRLTRSRARARLRGVY